MGPSTHEPTVPWPPPFRWLKRIALAWFIVIALLLIVRLIWGWEIDRRMRDQLAEWRALGQPTRPEDFAEPEVADEENAALVLKGLRALGTRPWEGSNDLRLPLSPGMVEAVETRVKRNASTLDVVRRARGMPKARWGYITSADENGQWPAPRLGLHNVAVGLIHAAALAAHQQGDDARALEYVLDLFGIVNADRAQPSIMHADGRAGWMAQRALAEIAADFNGGAVKASPAATGAVLAELLDETGRTSALVRGLHAERCRLSGGYRQHGKFVAHDPSTTQAWHAIAAWLIRPAIDTLALRKMTLLTQAADQIDSGRVHSALQAEATTCNPDAHRFGLLQRFCRVADRGNAWWESIHALPRHSLQTRADARATAILLSIRLYQFDHAGRHPTTLSELAPTYLPAVPDDPFSGRPFRYEPAADPPFLLSVGDDGVDDLAAGTWRPTDWSMRTNWDRGRRDAIYPLTRQPVPSGPNAVQADEHEHDEQMKPEAPDGEEGKP